VVLSVDATRYQLRLKVKGPPASVLKRVELPLPLIEDDEPDPINFLM
jgi:hypothetical protein